MSEPNYAVRPMRRADIARVAQIHRAMFPTSRSSQLGDAFVRRMYRWFQGKQSALSLVAVADGKVVGFMTGAVGGYGRRITRYAAPHIAWGMLRNPRLFLNRDTLRGAGSYLQAFRPNYGAPKQGAAGSAEAAPAPRKASIGSVAVLQEYGGRGIGKALMTAFENAARAGEVRLLGLSVEANNAAARRLYESCGWQVQSETEHDVYYTKALD